MVCQLVDHLNKRMYIIKFQRIYLSLAYSCLQLLNRCLVYSGITSAASDQNLINDINLTRARRVHVYDTI